MATRQAPTTTRPATSFCLLRALFFITVATVNVPAMANYSTPPSTLVIYGHQNNVPPDANIVEVASPSGNLAFPEFGTVSVIAEVIRETAAADSPVLGSINGLVTFEKDLSVFAANTYVLNTTSYAGTISIQGVGNQQGVGKIAITGGTGDFRFARGYADVTLVSQADPRDVVFKLVFTIKYD